MNKYSKSECMFKKNSKIVKYKATKYQLYVDKVLCQMHTKLIIYITTINIYNKSQIVIRLNLNF